MITQRSLARFLMHPTRYHHVRMMPEMGVRQMPARGLEWIRQSGGNHHCRVCDAKFTGFALTKEGREPGLRIDEEAGHLARHQFERDIVKP